MSFNREDRTSPPPVDEKDKDADTGGARDDNKMARRAAISGFLGSAIEYYDFLIYGTAAALVLGKLYFPSESAAAATLAALATFGIAYIARPAGAILFGHFGDRVGRKRVLQVTILLMGGSSTLVGLLPTYGSIGIAAPALLVLCRVLQGLSAGSEQTGSSLLTLEHSTKKKSFYASWTPNGASVGSAAATAIFIPISALPSDALTTWGWRVPFLLSIITVPITLFIRRGVDESPEFARRADKETKRGRAPLISVLLGQPRALVCVFVCALVQSLSSFVTVFGLSFADMDGNVGHTPMLTAITVSQLVSVFFAPLWAVTSDRYGHKRVFVVGVLACAVGSFAFLAAIASGSWLLTIVATILLKGVAYAAPHAIWPTFYGQQFTADVRYTGTGTAMQMSYVVLGFLPAICTTLLAGETGAWPLAALFMGSVCVAAAIAGAFSRPAPERSPAAA